jgi:hypothetical protein
MDGKYGLRFITMERRDSEERKIIEDKKLLRWNLLKYRINDFSYVNLYLMAKYKEQEWRQHGPALTPRECEEAKAVSERASIMLQVERESAHSEILQEIFGQKNPKAVFEAGAHIDW